MSAAGVALIGVLGLVVGSVVWVIARAADRAPLGGPVCANPECGAPLPPVAWLPLLGFGAARRCARCGAAQPRKRALFELATAAYFALAAASFGDDGLRLAATLVFTVPLLLVFLVDWWTRFIHTDVIGVGVVAGLGFALADGGGAFLSALLSALGAVAVFAFFFVLTALIYRNLRVVPFGLGDVYLAAMIGTMARYPAVINALFSGVLLAGLGGVLLLLTRRVGRRDPIPYGPYLCVGALLALLG